MLFSGEINGQGIEVVADHFGTEILASGQPGKARSVFEIEAMLDTLESLFDTPALVIELAEIKGIDIEQGSHQNPQLSIRGDLADQSDG